MTYLDKLKEETNVRLKHESFEERIKLLLFNIKSLISENPDYLDKFENLVKEFNKTIQEDLKNHYDLSSYESIDF